MDTELTQAKRELPVCRGDSPRSLVFLFLVLAAMLAISLHGVWQETGRGYLEEAAGRATAAFAIARGLNAAISVVQEVEVGFSLGLNGSFQPGQALDPLNDLVERFSLAALVAATLLWTLRFLGELLATPWTAILLLPLAVTGFLLLRLDRWGGREAGRAAYRLVRAVVVVWLFAFLTPLFIHQVHHSDVVNGFYTSASQNLQQARETLTGLTDFDGVPTLDDLGVRTDRILALADSLSRDAIRLLAIFLFEVIVIPLLVFWMGKRLLLRGSAPA